MRREQYRELMEMLDAAVNNGFEDEMMEMSAFRIIDEITDLTGTRSFEDVSQDELFNAIQGWQERQEDL